MIANLILILMPDELNYFFSNTQIWLRKKLCQCGIEIGNIIIYNSFDEIISKATTTFEECSVVVSNFNNSDKLFSVLSNKYVTKAQPHKCGSFWFNKTMGKCFYINLDNLSEETFDKKLFKQIIQPNSTNNCIKLFGLDGVEVKRILTSLPKPSSIDYSVFSSFLDCEINFFTNNETLNTQVISNYFRQVHETFNDYIYSDNDEELIEKVCELLEVRNMNISICDCLTNGNLKLKINKIERIKPFLCENYVLNNKDEYIQTLKISPAFLARNDINSIETAYEITINMLQNTTADIGVCVSGTFQKPIIAVGDKEAVHFYKFNFKNNKEVVKNIIINTALFKLLKKLKQNDLSFYEK